MSGQTQNKIDGRNENSTTLEPESNDGNNTLIAVLSTSISAVIVAAVALLLYLCVSRRNGKWH